MDACFRLNNRLRSSDVKDPVLGAGLAYLLNSQPYHEHLKHYVNKDEVRSSGQVLGNKSDEQAIDQ